MSLMMMKTNPITPPPELVQQWYQEADSQLRPYYVYIAIRAAQ
jgi:outer membrane protein W